MFVLLLGPFGTSVVGGNEPETLAAPTLRFGPARDPCSPRDTAPEPSVRDELFWVHPSDGCPRG